MSPRKRKRSQAFRDSDPEPEDTDSGEQHGGAVRADADAVQIEKEREIWDAFREEHYEVVEQLPLTLHRQLSLMNQLDEQVHGYVGNLLPILVKYIELRGTLPKLTQAKDYQSAIGEVEGVHESTTSKMNVIDASHNASKLHTPIFLPVERTKVPESTRGLLSHIAWLSEELLRASQEKVNLGQAAHDSVDRHIRLLHLAIREQEAFLESKSENKSICIHLPDLVAHRWTRSAPLSSSFGNNHHTAGQWDEDAFEGKGGINRGTEPTSETYALKITLPPAKNAREVNPGEELYCYCDRVSFGEMIACDHPDCVREWFHLGCVGLTEPPEGEWYCEDCREHEI